MSKMFPSKEVIRLFLRRHVMRAKIDRDQLRCLADCLEKPNPRQSKKTWWLCWILFIPLFYALYVLGHRIRGTLRKFCDTKKNCSTGPRHLGRQLMAPAIDTMTEDPQQRIWDAYWTHQDLWLRTFLLKKKMLERERKNMFTPRPAFEITEIPITTTTIKNDRQNWLPVCKVKYVPSDNITLNLSEYNGSLEVLYPMVKQGGLYSPYDCWPRQKVAILVPYRNRPENLKTFLINIHPFLMAQQLEYRIFVVEQHGKNKFNKGRLLNAGFRVMEKLGQWHCVVFHDVDLLPLNPRILYSCTTYPRLMSTALVFINGSTCNTRDFHPRFGGVVAMTPEQYKRVNGHSNLYRGWGNEDLDMHMRLLAAGIRITKNSRTISRYVHLPHPPEANQDINRCLLFNAQHRYKIEGLSTLEYKALNVAYNHLFTHILVALDEKPRQKIFFKYVKKLPVYNQSLFTSGNL